MKICPRCGTPNAIDKPKLELDDKLYDYFRENPDELINYLEENASSYAETEEEMAEAEEYVSKLRDQLGVMNIVQRKIINKASALLLLILFIQKEKALRKGSKRE